jgi:hypothetical protein
MIMEYKIQMYFVAIFCCCCLEVYRNCLVTVARMRAARTQNIYRMTSSCVYRAGNCTTATRKPDTSSVSGLQINPRHCVAFAELYQCGDALAMLGDGSANFCKPIADHHQRAV